MAVDLPLNVDSQRCFADDPAGVAETVAAMAARGAAGCSIEDYDPATGRIDPLDVAVERVAAAAEAAHRHGVVLTARAENHVYDLGELDDTVQRLIAYREVGADVVYAPRLSAADDIRRVVEATDAPANVLAMRNAPSVRELEVMGVRRVSTGGALALCCVRRAGRSRGELPRSSGTSTYVDAAMTGDGLEKALGGGRRGQRPAHLGAQVSLLDLEKDRRCTTPRGVLRWPGPARRSKPAGRHTSVRDRHRSRDVA